MVKTIIIDDEMMVRSNLTNMLLGENLDIKLCGEADNFQDALTLIKKVSPQLVFLDIQLGEYTGFDILDNLDTINFQVIFITAYDKYAIKAFKYLAIDYLLKPIHPDELNKAVSMALKKIKNNTKDNIQSLINDIKNKEISNIAITSSSGLSFYKVNEIARIESASNYCIVHTVDRKVITTRSLKEFEGILESRFIRIHRSHLINIKFIQRHKKNNGGSIVLTNGVELPISRSRKSALLNILYNQ